MKEALYALGAVLALLLGGVVASGGNSIMYVPPKCIRDITWTKPCKQLSSSMLQCDRVMLRIACDSAVPSQDHTLILKAPPVPKEN